MKTILILGAGGRLGAAATTAFSQAGWNVIAHARKPLEHRTLGHVRTVSLPLANTEALVRDVERADVVLYAVNPPYTAWRTEAQPLLDQGIALAQRLGATILLPGNVYNFWRAMTLNTTESAPHTAHTVKGQIRIEMERSLERAAAAGTQTVILRAGDFFGTGAGSWFDLAMAKKIEQGKFTYPGALDVPHAWAYLPDLARAFVALAERRTQLGGFASFNFSGHTLTGNDWLRALQPIADAQGWTRPGARIKTASIPWGFMKFGAPFVPIWRELAEMQYLWDVPHALNSDALAHALGAAPTITPFPEALNAALRDLAMIKN